MAQRNQSIVTEFILTGFPGLHQEYYGLVSAALFLVYLVTMIANATVIFLFATDCSLHKPMYYIILNLSVCDVLFSTTTLPKIITKYWFQSGSISFTACFVQMYFVHYLGTVNSYILFQMALDRYLAICHPLRYPHFLTTSNILILSITAWTTAKAGPLMAPYAVPAFVTAMLTLLGPLAFIIFSYCSIIIAVYKIANMQGRLKSLSTCSTQLRIISLYYLPRCFVYLASNVVIIMLYSLAPPVINPLIYCLRAKDMRDSLLKLFCRRTVPEKAQIAANK
ncbi:olfactory receptor 2AT4-like [Archocentrus centrarchus]|uniref:olfactory receptor 2AT4-like n=1 Tax=Archocentrus centrarchus TaxID=63155 RepID=UPI0011E9CF60|nr:olfactory receptor 2AT4-like [Archocentrus centrarchus]